MNQCKREGCDNLTIHEHGFCETCGELVWEFYMAHGFGRHSEDVLPAVGREQREAYIGLWDIQEDE